MALISADYSQIEPRLLSHVADDPTMIKAYIDGQDLYAFMASRVFSLVASRTAEKLNLQLSQASRSFQQIDPKLQVEHLSPLNKRLIEDNFVYYDDGMGGWSFRNLSPDDCYDGTLYRKMMKTLLLGMMYSMSEKGLAARLKIDEADAKDIMDFFFKAFPNIKKKINELQRFCKSEGYIETDWGRKRRIPDIWSEEFWIRKKAERQVLNSDIQGGAADIMKIAMILVGYDPRIKALGAKLLLTVHDELIVEAPKNNAIQVAKYLVEDMCNAAQLKVPLKVDAEIFIDGRWYGESIDLKRKGDSWKILKKEKYVDENGKECKRDVEITEAEIQWAV